MPVSYAESDTAHFTIVYLYRCLLLATTNSAIYPRDFRPARYSHSGRGRQRQWQLGEVLQQFKETYLEFKLEDELFREGGDSVMTPSISNTHAGGSPSRISGPLVAKYQLVDLLEYSVSAP
jgi:hypothetical protein